MNKKQIIWFIGLKVLELILVVLLVITFISLITPPTKIYCGLNNIFCIFSYFLVIMACIFFLGFIIITFKDIMKKNWELASRMAKR